MEADLPPDPSITWKKTLYSAVFAQLVASMGFSSAFPFLPLYVAELGSVTFLGVSFLTGMVFSAQAMVMMFASPLWGNLADRYGRKIMVERAMFGGAVVLSLMGFVSSAEELVLLKALQGAVTGVIGANSAMVAAATPREHTGRAMGMLQMASATGMSLGPLLGGFVADLWGYRATFWVTGSALFMAGVVVWLGVKETFEPGASGPRKKGRFFSDFIGLLKNKKLAIAYSLRFSCRFCRAMVIPLFPLYVAELFLGKQGLNSFTGFAIGISAVFISFGAAVIGRIGDRVGHRLILGVCLMANGLLYCLFILSDAGWQVLALQAGVGLSLGGIMPSVSALLTKYSEPGQEGRVFGLDGSVIAGARSIGPLASVGLAAWLGIAETFLIIGFIALASGVAALKILPAKHIQTA